MIRGGCARWPCSSRLPGSNGRLPPTRPSRHGLIADPVFTAEQGHWMSRPGQASVEALGPRDAMTGVRVAGAAVATVRGELFLP